MSRDAAFEFAQALSALEAAAGLLSGKGSPTMVGVLRTATSSPNPRIAASADTLLTLYCGANWRLIAETAGSVYDALPSDVEPSNVVELVTPQPAGKIIDFDARNLRRDLARAATPWPTPGGGYDPLNDGAA